MANCPRIINHPFWKGDDVGYKVLHKWVRRHLPKPEECELCRQKKTLEVANISGDYLRDLNDWEWLCRTCHMTKDGRMEKFNEISKATAFSSTRQPKRK